MADTYQDVYGDIYGGVSATSWRLINPQVVDRYQVRGSLAVNITREVTVFGDENGLFTSDLGNLPDGGGDSYGAIPFGTRYIWFGGHQNITDDPDIRELWVTNGFEVEDVELP